MFIENEKTGTAYKAVVALDGDVYIAIVQQLLHRRPGPGNATWGASKIVFRSGPCKGRWDAQDVASAACESLAANHAYLN